MAKAEYIEFDYVKRQADFLAVLEHYGLEPKGRGVQRTLLCPFHADTRPSLKINLGRKAWHCFGCGGKGNILEFVARMEDVGDDAAGLRAAARTLAEICAIELAPEGALRRARTARSARSGAKTTK